MMTLTWPIGEYLTTFSPCAIACCFFSSTTFCTDAGRLGGATAVATGVDEEPGAFDLSAFLASSLLPPAGGLTGGGGNGIVTV